MQKSALNHQLLMLLFLVKLIRYLLQVAESLGGFISTIKKELNENETELAEFFSNPELIDDPITLFRVSVRRQELLQEAYFSITAPILTETY
jgi:hypothetical protein